MACQVSPPPRRRGSRLLLGALLLAFLAAFLVAGSERWHQCLHDQGGGDTHQCLATILQGGLAEATGPVLSVPGAPDCLTFPSEWASQTAVSSHLLLLPEERGPPV